MERKGFPESYDLPALLRFLSDIKAGRRPARAPVYSHLVYDVVPNHWIEIDRPDILIVEGLNVLQTGRLPKDGKAIPFVSDFFDFSVYLDADEDVLMRWYVDRFLAVARDVVPRSEIIFPSLFPAERPGGSGDGDLDLEPDQSRQSARKHSADTPARRPHPQEARKPLRRGSRAAQALTAGIRAIKQRAGRFVRRVRREAVRGRAASSGSHPCRPQGRPRGSPQRRRR